MSIYPLVRFRAALGLGLFGLMFLAKGMPLALLAAVGGSAGLFLATLLIDLVPVSAAALAAVGGMGGLAYFLLSA